MDFSSAPDDLIFIRASKNQRAYSLVSMKSASDNQLALFSNIRKQTKNIPQFSSISFINWVEKKYKEGIQVYMPLLYPLHMIRDFYMFSQIFIFPLTLEKLRKLHFSILRALQIKRKKGGMRGVMIRNQRISVINLNTCLR